MDFDVGETTIVTEQRFGQLMQEWCDTGKGLLESIRIGTISDDTGVNYTPLVEEYTTGLICRPDTEAFNTMEGALQMVGRCWDITSHNNKVEYIKKN